MGALAGFAAFVYDPFAQGERMQPPAGGCCDGHNRYGALAELLGTSAARQRIWDGMRALDYLETRADIRKDGFGCMGNSGGGTESALLEVADPRIVAACPSCWISTLRDTCRACGPQDAEQLTFGQLAFGFNHASYVLAGGNAVRVHCNFEDFFPYSGTCETMTIVTNVAVRCGLGPRYGMTDVTGPHAWKESSRTSSVLRTHCVAAGGAGRDAFHLRNHRRKGLSGSHGEGSRRVDVCTLGLPMSPNGCPAVMFSPIFHSAGMTCFGFIEN